MALMRHSKTADGLPLSGEERSCGGHHPDDHTTKTRSGHHRRGTAYTIWPQLARPLTRANDDL
jgi:hypothetical protein